LLGAFLVVGAVIWLLKLMRESDARAEFKAQRIALMGLLTLQLWLGVESWLAKFFVAAAHNQQAIAPMPTHAEWIRTAHYLVGTLLFATTVSVVLIAHRKTVPVTAIVPAHKLEGAL
jgi:heme A synthase